MVNMLGQATWIKLNFNSYLCERDVINDQLQVIAYVESRSAELDDDAQPVDEGLIFHGVV